MLTLLLASCILQPSVQGPLDDVPDDTATEDTPVDSPADTEAPPPILVPVGHDRELRGAWIATVANINWPSARNLTPAQGQAELRAILDVLKEAGFNAIFFQVRPEGDALYASELEPWSRFLTGTQGQDPGWDPLAFVIEEAHARGIEVHAWMNPYRAKSDYNSVSVAPHLSVTHPEHAKRYGALLWMDPGEAVVRERLVAVVRDVTRRYDVDGIHFDDYFYPYPDGTPFPDSTSYAAYQAAGGTMSRDDWRRDNVNRAMSEVSTAVSSEKDHVRFGISPFGIYRPGQPAGITGLDQYAEIYSDPVAWVEAGWVDYLAPQLYWPSTQTAQAYGPLASWWADIPSEPHWTFPGNALYRLGDNESWTIEEVREQIELTRLTRDRGGMGNIWFHVGPLMENRSGVRDRFRDDWYKAPALTPPMADFEGRPVLAPAIRLSGADVTATHQDAVPLRAFAVYAEAEGDTYALHRLEFDGSFTLEPGRYAISAVTRHGAESPGVVVEVIAP